MKRKNPTLREKLAATLLEYQRLRGDPIDREHAKQMTAEQICSLFQFDHSAGYAAHGKDNHPTGLTPLLIGEHREKTAKFDIPTMRKGERLAQKEARHRATRARILERTAVQPVDRAEGLKKYGQSLRKMHGPRFSDQHRPLQSRSSFEKRKP